MKVIGIWMHVFVRQSQLHVGGEKGFQIQ